MLEALARLPAGVRVSCASLVAGIVAFALSVLVPLRAQGSDTIPGRLGGVTLACLGTHDLARIQWVALPATRGHVPYWVVIAKEGTSLVSTFGPGPAWAAAPAMRGLDRARPIDDLELERRARLASAALVGVSATLLVVGLSAVAPTLVGFVAALLVALSFAGAATLGQGLWQQTVSLPFVMAGVAALAWSLRSPRWGVLVPGFLCVAVLLRPPEVGLVASLGVAWIVTAQRGGLSVLALSAAFGLTAVLAAPLIIWNLAYLDQVLPVGQWYTNLTFAENQRVFDLSPAHLVEGLLGLLVSPARGLLWYAPVVVIVVALGSRTPGLPRIAALAAVLEWLVSAAFFRWWGGSAFGPRLLNTAVWVSIVGAGAQWMTLSRAWRQAIGATAAMTCLVGVTGLLRFDLNLWDQVRKPDADPSVLWDVAGSPLLVLFSGARPERPHVDAQAGPFLFCPPDGHWALYGLSERMWRSYGPEGAPGVAR